MKLKNYEIYGIAQRLIEVFPEGSTKNFPIKLSFVIKKNMGRFVQAAELIEASRIDLVKRYGRIEEDGSYKIDPDSEENANKEFTELMNLDDDIPVSTINIKTLPDDLELTEDQMDILMIMLVDDTEEE